MKSFFNEPRLNQSNDPYLEARKKFGFTYHIPLSIWLSFSNNVLPALYVAAC